MTFKKLDTIKKVYFMIFIFLASSCVCLSFLTQDIAMLGLGLMSFLECCNIFTSQEKDDLLDSYNNLLEENRRISTQNYKLISKAIKENNPTRLKYITDILDLYWGKEEDNDSNKG